MKGYYSKSIYKMKADKGENRQLRIES